jgi:hypothetical protein
MVPAATELPTAAITTAATSANASVDQLAEVCNWVSVFVTPPK